MFHEAEPVAPEGYDTWRPRMGRGGRLLAWLILFMIGVGSALMAWQALATLSSRLRPAALPRLHVSPAAIECPTPYWANARAANWDGL